MINDKQHGSLLQALVLEGKLDLRDTFHKNSICLLTGGKIPHNKGGHFPFRKFQLDSRTFGMEILIRLWPHYHSKGALFGGI